MLLNNQNKSNTTKKHERFALEYMVDYDIIRAYKVVYDEDGTLDDVSARTAAGKLLRSIVVQTVIDREECRVIGERRLEKDMLILQVQRMYSNAMRDRDYGNAGKALDMLAKHFGFYQKHNAQKKYSPEDIKAIRNKLESHGVSFDAPNKPNVLDAANPYVIEDAIVETDKEELT